MKVSTHRSLDAIPGAVDRLWRDERGAPFATRAWWEDYVAETKEPGERLRLFAVERGDIAPEPIGILPGFTSRVYGAYRKARVLRFYQPDSVPFAPALAEGVGAEDVVAAVLGHAAAIEPSYEVIRMSPLARPSPLFDRVTSTLRAAGYVVQPYLMFMNRFEETEGVDSRTYIERRSSRLRSTIVRRTRALERSRRARYELVTDETRLASVIGDYDRVLETSWKMSERIVPPEYVHAIMRTAARAGALRLGLLYVDEMPAAAQFWLVSAGTGICYRLAFNERFRSLSVGTVSTWYMVRDLLDRDGVRSLDFGVGDDPYKADWMVGLRERWGVESFDPRTLRGLRGILRHVAPQPFKRGLQAAWHVVKPRLRRIARR